MLLSVFGRRAVDGKRNNHKTHEQRVICDPQVCDGEPVFKGTRVNLRTVLASLAAGDTAEQIIADFPTLHAENVQAAIAFAAASAGEDLPVLANPQIR